MAWGSYFVFEELPNVVRRPQSYQASQVGIGATAIYGDPTPGDQKYRYLR